MTKYRAKKTVLDGIEFDSKREATRWAVLRVRERIGEISGLQRQVPFVLAPGVRLAGEKRARPAIRFVADFVYQVGDQRVIEDVKGMDTPMSRLKRHLMATVLGLQVEVIK